MRHRLASLFSSLLERPESAPPWLDDLLEELPDSARDRLAELLSGLPEVASGKADKRSVLGQGSDDDGEEAEDDVDAGEAEDEPRGASGEHGPEHEPGEELPEQASDTAFERSALGGQSGAASQAALEDRDLITGSSFGPVPQSGRELPEQAQAFGFAAQAPGLPDPHPGRGVGLEGFGALLFQIPQAPFGEEWPGQGSAPAAWPPHASESFFAAHGRDGGHPAFHRSGVDHPVFG
jgi:hypothetical protein